MLERKFDVPFIAQLALKEKQIQQNYRPIIAVHKWFARRPGTLFRGLLLSEFGEGAVAEAFFQAHRFSGIRIADPFMGGGTPILEANRVGCDVIGFDINPMAYWIVKQEIEYLDLEAYRSEARALRAYLEQEIGPLYRTRCLYCGSEDAHVKYFLWVKTQNCSLCGDQIDLFPGYVVARNNRHPKNVLVCNECGELVEVDDLKDPGHCPNCDVELKVTGVAKRGKVACPTCHAVNPYPAPQDGPPRHRLFALEYYCPVCKATHKGRFFKKPDVQDLAHVREATKRWDQLEPTFVPDDLIPSGDETNRLHRWGYQRYAAMFNPRQLLGLELAARFISAVQDERVRHALATNFSDLLRYQNMLCRYDPASLKSLDIFSVHGFPVGLIQAESNMLGIHDPTSQKLVGSGGWANITEKFYKAKSYCYHPFEIRHGGKRKKVVPIPGEWIGDVNKEGDKKNVELYCLDAGAVSLPSNSLDGVFTDPPYFGNVQYAELIDFLYVWLRRLVGGEIEAFKSPSTRHVDELTANVDMGRGIEHFTKGVSGVFQAMSRALKPGAPFVFTYHHNDLDAYLPIAVAILDAGLTCTATLPSPAEMGASIHISGTKSSIVDTVFVCRTTGSITKRLLADSPQAVAELVRKDIEALKMGGVKATEGDARCLAFGHLIRLAIWEHRRHWSESESVQRKLYVLRDWLQHFGDWGLIRSYLYDEKAVPNEQLVFSFGESSPQYGVSDDEISF